MAIAQDDAVFARVTDPLAPAQQVAGRSGETPLRMHRQVLAAPGHQLCQVAGLTEEMIAHAAEVVLVPVRFDGAQGCSRFAGEHARRVRIEIALVVFAARLEVERLPSRITPGNLDIAFVESAEARQV